MKHPQYPCNVDAWNRDWTLVRTEKNLRTSYGHDVECAWLVLEAANALGRKPASLRNWAQAICAHSIGFGFDKTHGGFFASGPLTGMSDDRQKIWWTQAEAMVAMLVMKRLTGEEGYQDLFETTFHFVEQHHVASDGGWWATLEADGSFGGSQSRTSMWQGAYHNGRSLLMCERLLRSE
ncbi:MAG: AGE family epimerase/isomerase [Planctomycetota bacterium]